jgi:hypothetical protein
VLLEKGTDTAYLGTTKGCIEIWNLAEREKKGELRYLTFNEFGEAVPVDDPVVNIAAPLDFKYVYAFMGNAAYCVDPKLKIIVQEIPISERVIFGCVAPLTGEIGVVTEPGYFSLWSIAFEERTSSHEFMFFIENAYLIQDYDSKKLILVLEEDRVILVNFNEPQTYILDTSYPGISQVLNTHWFDRNEKYFMFIDEKGKLEVRDSQYKHEKIEKLTLFDGGNFNIADKVRELITRLDEESEDERVYIEDYRLSRRSKDRYSAEIDQISSKESSRHTPTGKLNLMGEDTKTLSYAFQEYLSDDLHHKAQATGVISKIAKRHNIELEYVLYVLKYHPDQSDEYLELSRFYQTKYKQRKKRLNQIIIAVISLIIIQLIITQFSDDITWFYIMNVFLFTGMILILNYWKSLNKDPEIHNFQDFMGLRLFMWIFSILNLIVSIYLGNDYIRSWIDYILSFISVSTP